MQSGVLLSGRYRLTERLGRGGMGEVWRAEDLQLDRQVAVKIVLADLDAPDSLLARLRREARTAGALQHPGITVVHDIGEHEGHPYFVMELLTGKDLKTLLAENPGGLPVERVVSLLVPVADALAYAHRKGVVHRDIKPANLIEMADGGVKICDFGISRYAGAGTGLTTPGTVLGTLAYMAPEQYAGGEVDARADLYSLGCTLYALLTGAPPFTGDSSVKLMYQHLNDPPPRPAAARTQIPAALEELTLQLLAKRPAHRPQSAGVVGQRLRSLASGAAPAAASPPAAQHPTRAAARPPAPQHPARATAGTAPQVRRGPRRVWPLGLGAAGVALIVAATFVASRFLSDGGSPTGGGHTSNGLAPGATTGVRQVTLGFMGALTGENSGLVIPAHRGAQLAIDEYNSGNPATKITLKDYDTLGQPDKAPSLATTAIQSDKVTGMIGPMFSGESAAVGAIFEKKVPTVSPSATDPALGQKHWTYWHRIVANDTAQGQGMGTFIGSVLSWRKVFVIDDGSEYGRPLATEVRKTVERTGATIITDRIDPQASDYGSTVNKARAFDPNVIFFGGYYTQTGPLIKQLRAGGVQARVLSGDGSLEPSLANATGSPTAYDSIFSCSCLADPTGKIGAASKSFADRYQQKFGKATELFSAEGYDAATAFITAIKAGNTTPTKINAALASLDIAGVSGRIKFTATGEPAAPVVYLYQIKDGDLQLLGRTNEVKIHA